VVEGTLDDDEFQPFSRRRLASCSFDDVGVRALRGDLLAMEAEAGAGAGAGATRSTRLTLSPPAPPRLILTLSGVDTISFKLFSISSTSRLCLLLLLLLSITSSIFTWDASSVLNA
jgi:hypothetical protein